MSEKKGTISANDLMMKLVQAKKVMNKVETGSFERGNINEDFIRMSPEEAMKANIETQPKTVQKPTNVQRIKESKLPDAIKKAMIENPIPQISLNDTIDMDIVKGAKKLMEREGMISKPKNNTSNQINSGDIISTITPIIENVVRKVLDEKLNQILSAQQTLSINENLVLKVGDSVFKGKITGVNKSK